MTPRQPRGEMQLTPARRSRRANQEGSAPRQRPDGRWEIRVRYTDALGRETRPSVYGKTAKECREKAEKLRRGIAAGRPAKAAKESMAVYALAWSESTLAASQDHAKSTKDNYAAHIRNHIVGSALGQLPLSRVSAKDVETWIVSLRDKGLKDSTVQTIYGVLRLVLDTAVRDRKVMINAAKEVKRPRIQDQEEALYLTPEQIKTFLAIAYHGLAVPQRGGRPTGRAKRGTMTVGKTRYAPLFELLVNTGLRRGEVLGLRWCDIDFDEGTLRVRRTLGRVRVDSANAEDGKRSQLEIGRVKTPKSERVIDLTVGAMRVLRERRTRQRADRLAAGPAWQSPPALLPRAKESDYVFTTELGNWCEPRGVYRAVKTVIDLMADQEGIGVHSLRHSFASTMLEMGAPTKAVQEALGHTNEGFTSKTYLHVSKRTRQSAFDLVSKALG